MSESPDERFVGVAAVARVLGDPIRVRLVWRLTESPATVSELASTCALAQPKVSAHLKVLAEGGLVEAERQGRQRVYRVSGRADRVLAALLGLSSGAGTLTGPRAAREVMHNTSLRSARSCYDHLAGVAGVQLLDQLLARGWLEPQTDQGGRVLYAVTTDGDRPLSARGIDLVGLSARRRLFAFGCPDWTENRPHLGGALGAAILNRLIDDGVVAARAGSRALAAMRPIEDWLDG